MTIWCRASGTSRSRAGGARLRGQRKDGANVIAVSKLNLQKWIKANWRHLKPPVSNKQFFADSKDVIVFVSGGPNTRNDFHVNPTEELFYQLKGDIAVRVRPKEPSPALRYQKSSPPAATSSSAPPDSSDCAAMSLADS